MKNINNEISLNALNNETRSSTSRGRYLGVNIPAVATGLKVRLLGRTHVDWVLLLSYSYFMLVDMSRYTKYYVDILYIDNLTRLEHGGIAQW